MSFVPNPAGILAGRKAQEQAGYQAKYGSYGSAGGFQDDGTNESMQRGASRSSTSLLDSYSKRAMGFDPMKALTGYAQGAMASTQANMNDELTALKGSAVGAGRLDTGFFDQDSGDVVRRNMADFNSKIAQQSMNAAGLEEQNNEDIGRMGEQQRTDYYDLVTGQRDYRTGKQNAKRQSRDSLINGGLQLAGTAAALL